MKTLPPNKKQTAAYIKKRQVAAADAAAKHEALPAKWAEPSQLKCVCIYDTQSKQFVGTVCYVISSEPPIGEIARFDTMSAEFVEAAPRRRLLRSEKCAVRDGRASLRFSRR